MLVKVSLTRKAEKQLRRVPNSIKLLFEYWLKTIEIEGIHTMQTSNGYRDHALKGDRKGQRSASLNRSWRIIYSMDTILNIITVEVLEITNHEY